MALDEPTASFLRQMAESGAKPLHEMEPHEARGLGATLRALYGPGPELDRVEDVVIAGRQAPIPLRILVPGEDPRAVIVYYHGGGWTMGTLDEYDTLARQLAQRAHAAVVLVDYRLAPEHPFPAALEDAWTAVQWVETHVETITSAPIPIVIAGDSAGGNLAAVIAQRAADRGAPAIAAQVLIYPVVDADLGTVSYTDPSNQLMLTREAMTGFWNHYAPDPDVRNSPELSPLRAATYSGLPPAVVITAEHDVLRDEGEEYARAMADAGVAVFHRRFEGQMHGFFTLVNVLPGSDDGLNFVAEHLKRMLSSTPTSAGQRR